MEEMEARRMVRNFPIGGEVQNRVDLLCKAAIIAYLARYQDQFKKIEDVDAREHSVREVLNDSLHVTKDEIIPPLPVAERQLKISSDFLHDINKIQLIRESNPDFNAIYDRIAREVELSLSNDKVM